MFETKIEKAIAGFFAAAFFTSTLFIFGPTYIYYSNILEFSYAYPPIFKKLVLLFIVTTPVLTIIFILLQLKDKLFEKCISLLCGVSFLLWLQGNILVWHYGALGAQEISWPNYTFYGYIDSAVWLICLFLAFYKSKIVSKLALKLSVVFICIQLTSVAFTYYNAPKPSFNDYVIDEKDKFTFSNRKNVILLVLDSFQSDIFQEILNEDEKYRNVLDGFTYFRNASSGYWITYLSVPNFLTGRYYDNTIPIQTFIEEAFMEESLPRVLKETGFRVELYPWIKKSILVREEVATNIKKIKRTKLAKATNSLNPTGGRFMLDLTLFRHVPHFLKILVYNDQSWFLSRLSFMELINDLFARSPTKPKSDQENKIKDLRFFEDMISTANTIDDMDIFKYYHLVGIHGSLYLNKDMEYERMTNPDRGNLKQAAKGVLNLTDMFLEKLKQLGIYDNSFIFIIGDHGVRPNIGVKVDSVNPAAGIVPSRIPVQTMQAALPLFLVKPFNKRGELKTSNAPISLSDIPKTIASELRIMNNFPDKSIFNIREDERRTRYFYYGEFTNNNDYFTGQEYLISGFDWLDESWTKGRRFERKSRKHD